jgi:hypothetical protein
VPFLYLPNLREITYAGNKQRETKNKLKNNNNNIVKQFYILHIQPPLRIIKIKENEGITLLQNNQLP